MEDHALPLVPFFAARATDGSRITRYAVGLEKVPADFFADPDGVWTFEGLAQSAGFALDAGVAIGALRHAFNGHPAGAAVVTLNRAARPYVAIVECPVAVALEPRAASAA